MIVTIIIKYNGFYYYLGNRCMKTLPVKDSILMVENVQSAMLSATVFTTIQEARLDVDTLVYPFVVVEIANPKYKPTDLEGWDRYER